MSEDDERSSPEEQRIAELIANAERVPLQDPPPRVWAGIESELGGEGGSGAGPTTSRRGLLTGIAAGVAAGALGGWALPRVLRSTPTVLRSAALDALDTGVTEGRAVVESVDERLSLLVSVDRRLAAADGYLEVWMLNSDGERMVSVGVLAGETTRYPLTQSLLDEGFVVVDISREPFDADARHSADSLLRGRLS